MPRRKRSSNERKLKQGRGEGHGQSYTPFLYTREVPSLGKATRCKGWKTKRVHHVHSKLECDYLYILEWLQFVVDIREQYPLPLEATQKISERLGIKHPFDTRNYERLVVTTDFLIDVEIDGQKKLWARAIMSSANLNDLRTIEKLEIERTYWQELGVDWGIVTEHEIPKALAQNVEWLHSAFYPDEAPGIEPDMIPFFEQELFASLVSSDAMPLAKLCLRMDEQLGFGGGTSLWIVKHLIATRQWYVDMFSRIQPDKPIKASRNSALQMEVVKGS